MIQIIIFLFFLSIVSHFCFKKHDIEVQDNSIIEFKFNNAINIVLFICTLISGIISLVMLIITFYTKEINELIIALMFSFCTLISFLPYLYFKNTKVIYKNNKFYSYNSFGKFREFGVENIISVKEIPLEGIFLKFKDGKKFKIDVQMINYSKVKPILEKNNIPFDDKREKNKPIGW